MAIVTDFIAAINQISAERGINVEDVFVALEQAILVAYKKEYGIGRDEYIEPIEGEEIEEVEENIRVEMSREDGSFVIMALKVVVDKIEEDDKEILLKEAKLLSKELALGDSVEIELPKDGFGRIAAQTAKQVILQQIRESEKDAVLSEYSGKTGEVFTALMQRMQRGQVVFEIGKATAYMPQEEQISNEFYRVGERYKVLLKGIEETVRGRELIVSRASDDFLVELFAVEVPEIENGVVEVKAVAREAGSRSKMAVVSNQEGVDPIGSCVGQRGIRIANVMSELGEEKIDIIEWDEDLATFVANALSPAKVEDVKVDGNTATVKVEEDQLSLAIGRDGQNARLAWKLTELKIDIVGPDGKTTRTEDVIKDDETVEEGEEKTEKKVKKTKETKEEGGVSEALVKKLDKAGKSVDDVKEFTVDQLQELDGIGKVTAQKIFDAINA